MEILVTLGADVVPKNQLGPRTLARLKASEEIWASGRCKYWITTGSCCHPPEVQTVPTAHLMADWCLNLTDEYRPSKDQVITIDTARDTWEEVAGVTNFTDDQFDTLMSINVVSERRHLRRVKVIFAKAENMRVLTHPVHHDLSFAEIAQENFLLVYTHLDPHGRGPLPKHIRKSRTY